ncbi:MAG: hypothetical protein QG660_234, partial [Pseudomonadota bacterium]|nr:hypothetical protein [Pseudomonadota bacterium]
LARGDSRLFMPPPTPPASGVRRRWGDHRYHTRPRGPISQCAACGDHDIACTAPASSQNPRTSAGRPDADRCDQPPMPATPCRDFRTSRIADDNAGSLPAPSATATRSPLLRYSCARSSPKQKPARLCRGGLHSLLGATSHPIELALILFALIFDVKRNLVMRRIQVFPD